MKTPTELKLEDVLNLVEVDMRAAVLAAKSLNKEDYEYFQHFLSNMILHAEAAQYRGKVVEMSIILEMKLARILSIYFGAKDKVGALNSMVFDRMDLRRKINLFKTILKTRHPEVWRKEKTVIREIDNLIDFRNNLAHSMLDSTLEYNKEFRKKIKTIMKEGQKAGKIDEVQFAFYENHEFVFRTIKRDDVTDYHQRMFQIFGEVDRITKEIFPAYE